jgi:tRNA-specific 2-thiouridylase
MGEHRGFAGFTVGQRKGLGGGFSEAMFVLEIRPESREVVVGSRDELFSAGTRVTAVSWLTHSPPAIGEEIQVQIRHRALGVAAQIVGAETEGGILELRFAEPQRAVTPGQSAAIFRGDRLLGGGRIARALSL